MGATVVTNKTVAAFRDPKTGEVIYITFEETYDKRCYPQIPNWSAYAIGNFEQVMSSVYASAAACEGGSLQVRSGETKPETYLKSWRLCFSKPFQMDDLEITLELGGDSMYAPIPESHVDAALATLVRIGRLDVADALKAGPAKVSLHRDADVILALYGVGTSLSLWKVIRGLHGLGYADEALAPAIAKRPIATPAVAAFAMDKENVVVSIDGGPLKHVGSHCNAVRQYIRDVAYPVEMQCSFSAYRLIREFRDTCATAPDLPYDTVLTVTPSGTEYSYYVESAKKLAVKLGLFASVEAVPETYETTLGAVREAQEEYLLSTLEEGQVAWTLAPSAEVMSLPGAVGAGHSHQLGLF